MSIEKLEKIWPEWKVEKQLGRGSYGVVYKAVRSEHNVESTAAIKVISIPSEAGEVDSLRSEGLDMDATRNYLQNVVNEFVGEIQLMETLKGVQNIVSVEDYKVVEREGEIGWEIFIRMELLTPFNNYICDKNLSEEEVVKLGCDICTALEICAKRNVIHRDIKPENIFINDFGYFKLGDFGIARKLESVNDSLSQKGTFNYMAPEVAHGTEYDARVDIYSLGIVLYKLMNSNRLPFLNTEKQLLNPNDRRNAVERRIRGEALPAPCEASPAMAEVILRACAYEPEKRFASAAEMRKALEEVAVGTYQTSMDVAPVTAEVDPNATVSVRSAPPQHKNIDTFGDKKGKNATGKGKKNASAATEESVPRKKKFGKVVAVILALVILAGAGIVAVPKILDVMDKDGGSQSQETYYTGNAKERIERILNDAEQMAAAEDYEGALERVQDGADTFPESEVLKEKVAEYTVALTAQQKQTALDDAAALAQEGKYEEAMAIMEAALQVYVGDADCQNAYETYQNAHKDQLRKQAIAAADELAGQNDFEGAIARLEQEATATGETPEMAEKMEEYKAGYVQDAITKADECVARNEYSAALAYLNNANKKYPGYAGMEEKIAEVENLRGAAPDVTGENPNQGITAPQAGTDVDVVGAASMEEAVFVLRENINHASFVAGDNVDWYRFSTSANYSSYRLELKNNSVGASLYLFLYDQYQTELGSAYASKGYTKNLDVVLEANSEYWIQVRHNSNNAEGNYQFAAYEKVCDAGVNKDSAFAVKLDELNTKTLDVEGINDWYKFKTTENYSTYRFNVKNNNIGTTLYLTVYDEYDTELGMASASKGYTRYLDLRLNANKEYYVRISRSNSSYTGNYQFTVAEMLCEAGLTMEEAAVLELGVEKHSSLDTSFKDWYVVTV